jgi:hypothetical protein
VQLDEERRSALRRDDYLLDHGAEDLKRSGRIASSCSAASSASTFRL